MAAIDFSRLIETGYDLAGIPYVHFKSKDLDKNHQIGQLIHRLKDGKERIYQIYNLTDKLHNQEGGVCFVFNQIQQSQIQATGEEKKVNLEKDSIEVNLTKPLPPCQRLFQIFTEYQRPDRAPERSGETLNVGIVHSSFIPGYEEMVQSVEKNRKLPDIAKHIIQKFNESGSHLEFNEYDVQVNLTQSWDLLFSFDPKV